MKITKIWVVRDPSPGSELEDVLFETTADELAPYVIGTGASRWESEHTTLYTEAGEARRDAMQRMKKRHKSAVDIRDPRWKV